MPQDRQLAANVEAELKRDPRIGSDRFGISVRDGAVTISGFAHDFSEKLAVVEAAERVHGVQVVADEIKVVVPEASVRDDIRIAQAIERSFRSNFDVPSTVTAEVRGRSVTLRGQVDSDHRRGEALRLVRQIREVRSVVDRIVVTRSASPRDVEQRVSEALRRSAELDAQSITVTIDNGVVHLFGHVHSVLEKDAAKQAAMTAPGVATVDNQLAIRP